MTAEAFKPLLSQLPKTEKRHLMDWLEDEINDKPLEENTKLENILIKHITKKRKNNNLKPLKP